MAYKCPECGTQYVNPTICAGSPVVGGAITDYTKPVHDPAGAGYSKKQYKITDERGNVTVSEEWTLDSEAEAAPVSGDSTDQTVEELKDKLREYDLPVSGTKDELISRLNEYETTVSAGA